MTNYEKLQTDIRLLGLPVNDNYLKRIRENINNLTEIEFELFLLVFETIDHINVCDKYIEIYKMLIGFILHCKDLHGIMIPLFKNASSGYIVIIRYILNCSIGEKYVVHRYHKRISKIPNLYLIKRPLVDITKALYYSSYSCNDYEKIISTILALSRLNIFDYQNNPDDISFIHKSMKKISISNGIYFSRTNFNSTGFDSQVDRTFMWTYKNKLDYIMQANPENLTIYQPGTRSYNIDTIEEQKIKRDFTHKYISNIVESIGDPIDIVKDLIEYVTKNSIPISY